MDDESVNEVRAYALIMKEFGLSRLKSGDIELERELPRPKEKQQRQMTQAQVDDMNREIMFAAGGAVPMNLKDL